MLRVDLRAIEDGPVEVAGAVDPSDPVFEGIDMTLAEPVGATGRLSGAGPGRYYWRGTIQAVVATECRRCLAELKAPVRTQVELLFTDDAGTDDPAVYVIPKGTHVLELAEVVREELVLAVPQYPLCRDDCRGLCPQCGIDLNTGSCRCTPTADPRWGPLDALRESVSEEP